jgi:hypothetical protein
LSNGKPQKRFDCNPNFHKENLVFSSDSDDRTLMFQMLGAFAEFERSLIRERQREGFGANRRYRRRAAYEPEPFRWFAGTINRYKVVVLLPERALFGECAGALAGVQGHPKAIIE